MRKKRRQQSTLPFLIIGLGVVLIVVAIGWYLVAVNQPIAVQNFTTAEPDNSTDIVRVSLADAKAAYDLGQAVFVDVRGSSYYSDSHIPGALSIPLVDLPQRLGELDPEDWIIPY